MAHHTLDNEEYQTLIRGRGEALEQIAKLETELERIKQEDPGMRVAPLMRLARAELEIVRFAVANLNPENTRGWPVKALHILADLLPALPDHNADDKDLANELRAFARDCEQYALVRAKKREAQLASDASAPKGDLEPRHMTVELPSVTPIGE